MARGGLTKATLSGGAAVAVEMEKKKNTPVTVLSFYRAMNVTSRRRVARRELTEANLAVEGTPRSWPKATAAGRRPCRAVPCSDSPSTIAPPNFTISNCFIKLLPNSCSNLKNSQDMKSSEFRALQVLY
jgi:hypothetical protein